MAEINCSLNKIPMKLSNKNALEFINNIENETRKKDGNSLLEIMSRITKYEAKIWGPSIIGFGNYVHKYDSGRETKLPLSSFSPRKSSLVLYILNGFDNQQKLLEKLGKHKTGNICLYINKLVDIDLAILENMIKSSYLKNKEY